MTELQYTSLYERNINHIKYLFYDMQQVININENR